MEPLSLHLLLLLTFIGLLAGFIDAIAGGGGLLTLPALLAAGLPPAQALAPNKLQGSFGSLSASINFIRQGYVSPRRLWAAILCSLVGAGGGAFAVQRIAPGALRQIVPVLLGMATLYFIFSPRVADGHGERRMGDGVFALLFGPGIGFYAGFFGPGPGSFFAIACIALLGLRGAGKSSLGARLAETLGAPFVELDREVEREAGSNLGEVFSIYGQDAYRRFERRALERVLRQHDRAVIATGGSLVTDQDNYELLRERCYCVWLKASPEEHMSRVISQGDMRPFKGRSAALDEIRRLLADRDRLYARADAVVDTSGKAVRQSLAQLRNLVSKEEK